MELIESGNLENFTGNQLPEAAWVTPIPDAKVLPEGDPAEVAAARETIRLAFVTALQHLPARQRAALILCEVLKWQASEAAELLDTSTASINSALQRARATLAERHVDADAPAASPAEADQAELVARYVDAFERYDVNALVSMLHEDVVQSMPPYEHWLEGVDLVGKWFLGPGAACEGSRVLVTEANGCAAYAQYRVDPAGGWAPWSLCVLEWSGDRIVALNNFIDPALFPYFGLPEHLDEPAQVQ
jgi:RNA polymerase sigma-70 factor (ECF subfamily)